MSQYKKEKKEPKYKLDWIVYLIKPKYASRERVPTWALSMEQYITYPLRIREVNLLTDNTWGYKLTSLQIVKPILFIRDSDYVKIYDTETEIPWTFREEWLVEGTKKNWEQLEKNAITARVRGLLND